MAAKKKRVHKRVPPAKRKQGRPAEGEGVLSPEAKAKFIEGIRTMGLPMRHAAWSIGVHPSTVWHWRQRDPAFDAAVQAAEAESQTPVIAALRDKALIERDLGALIWLCKTRIPEFREPREQPIDIADEGKTGVSLIDHIVQQASRRAARGEISASALKDIVDALAKASEVMERAGLEQRIERLEAQQGG